MIMRSLFAFMIEVHEEIVQDDTFGVDWAGNVETARRVINHCGSSYLFQHIFGLHFVEDQHFFGVITFWVVFNL